MRQELSSKLEIDPVQQSKDIFRVPSPIIPVSRRKGKRGWEWVPSSPVTHVIRIWIWRSDRNGSLHAVLIDRDFNASSTLLSPLGIEFGMTELDRTVQELRREGKVTEEYAMDLYTQEAIYDENEERLINEQPGKEVVVSGGELFVGDTFEEVRMKAASKYPGRPYFSASLGRGEANVI